MLPLHHALDINLEQMTGFEPVSPAWKAGIINHYTTSTTWYSVPGSNQYSRL